MPTTPPDPPVPLQVGLELRFAIAACAIGDAARLAAWADATHICAPMTKPPTAATEPIRRTRAAFPATAQCRQA